MCSYHRKAAALLRRTAALGLAGCLLLSAGCGEGGIADSGYEVTEALLGQVDQEQLSSNRFTQLEPEGEKSLPGYGLEGYRQVAENEKLTLYLNEEKASVRVADRATGYVWGALENEETEDLNQTWKSFAQSVVSISYMDATGAVKQIGAGHGKASRKYTYQEDGFLLDVMFGEEIKISLTVSVTLKEDHLAFAVKDESIREEGDFFVNLLYFVPFFGSTVGAQTDGYLFVPDGSGALLRYQEPAKYLKAYSSRVYGLDYAIDNLGELNDLNCNRPVEFLKPECTVTMPVFGLTHGVNAQALFGRVAGGECYAYINATPAGVSTDYNWATASFVYRQVYSQPTSRNGAGVPVVQKNPNQVDPRLELYFLSGEDACYGGMARQYRKILTEEGVLGKSSPAGGPQLALDFVLADVEKGMLTNSTKEITDLETVNQAVETLGENGVERIALTLLGWQKGGLSGHLKSNTFRKTVLGDFDDLAEVKKLLEEQAGGLYLYADPLRAKEIQISSRRDAGITLSQSPIKTLALEEDTFLGDTWYLKPYLAMEYLTQQADAVENYGLKMTVDGGNLLYGEYLSDHFVSRSETLKQLESTYETLAGEEGLTLYRPNEYLLKYTGVYRDVPVSGSQDLYETDSVPFLEMVLSGSMTLVAPYANESFYSRIDLLKCIEYNAYPSFLLTGLENTKLEKTTLEAKSSTRFRDWQDTIRESYEFVRQALEPVEGQQMREHRRLTEYVFQSVYETGTVYVNYGDTEYELGNNIVIPAQCGMYVPE